MFKSLIHKILSTFSSSKISVLPSEGEKLPTMEQWMSKLEKRQKNSTDRRCITKVWLDESQNECDICGACEAICPQVFSVPEKMVVRADADLSLNEYIKEAADGCPVGVIAIEFDNSGKRDNPV